MIIIFRAHAGPPILKQIQSSFGVDYGLIRYDLKNDCNNNIACSIKHSPKATKSSYSRIGDALIGIATQNPQIDYAQVINPILADPTLPQKFLPQYLKQRSWTTTTPSGKTILDPSKKPFQHNYKQAKEILMSMKSHYPSPRKDEIVIYIRASDKLETINNGTCSGAS